MLGLQMTIVELKLFGVCISYCPPGWVSAYQYNCTVAATDRRTARRLAVAVASQDWRINKTHITKTELCELDKAIWGAAQ
jgi:hypothetical protein